MTGEELGYEGRMRVVGEALGRVLTTFTKKDFRPTDLEMPLTKLVELFPRDTSSILRTSAQRFIEATASGNPAGAGMAIADFIDLTFTASADPVALRPSYDRLLAAYQSQPAVFERIRSAIMAVDGRVAAADVEAQKRELVLRSEIEERFLRSERAALLIQRLHQEAASGRQKQDAMDVHGVTWFEVDSGRKVKRDFVLDKNVGPKIHRTIVQLRRRWAYMDLGIRAPGRILMDGPPGTGKTMAARYIAYLLGKPCAVMRLDEIVGKLIGDTAKNVNAVLEAVITREAVLFLDEVDGLFPPRDGDLTGSGGEELRRITSAFLQQVNLLPRRQIVICATNRPDALDEAFLRRFPDRISFTNPDEETRREIVRRVWKTLVSVPGAHTMLVEKTTDTSGDHVTNVAMAAGRIAADVLLDNKEVMVEIDEAAKTLAAEIVDQDVAAAKVKAAEGLVASGNAAEVVVTDVAAEATDDEIEAARAALEADRTRQLEEAKLAAFKAAKRRARKKLLRERVLINELAVEQGLKDTPPPPVYLGRDRAGRPIVLPDRQPPRPTSSLLHIPTTADVTALGRGHS